MSEEKMVRNVISAAGPVGWPPRQPVDDERDWPSWPPAERRSRARPWQPPRQHRSRPATCRAATPRRSRCWTRRVRPARRATRRWCGTPPARGEAGSSRTQGRDRRDREDGTSTAGTTRAGGPAGLSTGVSVGNEQHVLVDGGPNDPITVMTDPAVRVSGVYYRTASLTIESAQGDFVGARPAPGRTKPTLRR